MQGQVFRILLSATMWSLHCGAQNCVNNADLNIRNEEVIAINDNDVQVIIPHFSFNCNGRLTGVTARTTLFVCFNNVIPFFQIWRPLSSNLNTYNLITKIQFPSPTCEVILSRCVSGFSLMENARTEFQSGDVIGYYQPSSFCQIYHINTSDYTSYSISTTSSPNTVNISSANIDRLKPLIRVSFDVRCDDLTLPAYGNISCSSGRDGVGYERDTCNFTCNTGHVLTGNDTRTCLSNGSWSGIDATCRRVPCEWLGNTSGEMIVCMLGDNGYPTYEDTCIVTCNTGYELVGNNTRICQSNGSWNGKSDVCEKVQCTYSLSSPANGGIVCNSSGILHYEDQCLFSCDPGYELTGSSSRQCLSNGSWSGSDVTCNIIHCNSLTDTTVTIENSVLADSCGSEFGSVCRVECNTGYRAVGNDTFTCASVDDSVGWRNNGSFQCDIVSCVALSDPENGFVTCPSDKGVFRDMCTYYCNRGYQLEGNRLTTCGADGTWSSEPASCTILQCINDPKAEINNSQSVGECNMTYGSSCSLICLSGFRSSGSDVGRLVCNMDDEDTAVKWKITGGNFSCADTISSVNDEGVLAIVIAGAVGGGVILLLLVLLFTALWYYKRLQSKKSYPVSTVHSQAIKVANNDVKGSKESNTPNELYSSVETDMLNSNRMFRELNRLTILNEPKSLCSTESTMCTNLEMSESNKTYYEFETPDCSTVEKAISSMEQTHDYTASQPNYFVLLEEEQNIYETPCEDGNYGPIYIEPPTKVEKVYEIFEVKRFSKLNRQNIKIIGQLGSGEFGIVKHGQLSSPAGDIEVAVKTLNTSANDTDRLRFLQEAAIMCQFDHHNVIKLHGVVNEVPVMIVLEYVARGDLKQFLVQLQPLAQESIQLPLLLLKFCKEIAAGMTYLSGKQFVHRDLAARNVLVSEKCICKIADFGMSRDLIDTNYYITSGGKVPAKWTAPEALHYRKYSAQSDVWSYGCVMYEIWSLGYRPFEEFTNVETLEKIDAGYRLPPPSGCPRTMYRMMIRCWHPDPRSRPQFGQILKLMTDTNGGYLLGWSDEDKQIGGEDAMKLGARMQSTHSLYLDLQQTYHPKP